MSRDFNAFDYSKIPFMFSFNLDFESTDFMLCTQNAKNPSPLRLGWEEVYRKECLRGTEYIERNSRSFHIPKCHSIPSVIFSEILMLVMKLISIVNVIYQNTF